MRNKSFISVGDGCFDEQLYQNEDKPTDTSTQSALSEAESHSMKFAMQYGKYDLHAATERLRVLTLTDNPSVEEKLEKKYLRQWIVEQRERRY